MRSVRTFRPFAKELLGTVPYELRMRIIRNAFPTAYARLQERMTGQTEEGHSIKHFVERKSIFVHIPKAAGISIVRSLFPETAGSDYLGPGHATMTDYRLWLRPSELADFFKFTFVRNPWDRAYSAYRFLKKGGINSRDRAWARANLAAYPDFDSFVKGWMRPKGVLDALHFRPQYLFLTLPFSQKPRMDFVGYFENLEEDYRHVRSRVLGDDSEAGLIHANSSGAGASPSYRAVYSDEARRIVAEVYRKDIELFGYTFDGRRPSRDDRSVPLR